MLPFFWFSAKSEANRVGLHWHLQTYQAKRSQFLSCLLAYSRRVNTLLVLLKVVFLRASDSEMCRVKVLKRNALAANSLTPQQQNPSNVLADLVGMTIAALAMVTILLNNRVK